MPALLAARGVIAGPAERYMGLAALGGFSPVLFAMVAARMERRGGIGDLFRRLRIRGFGAGWYAVTLFLFPAIYLLGRATYGLVGTDGGMWVYLPENAQHVAAMMLIPWAEEPGWRGYALPRLQRKYRPLTASLILGAAWAAWHVVMFLLQGFGASPGVFALALVNIVVGSVVFSWLFNRTNGSLAIAVLAHVSAHLCNPTHALPANATPFVVYTVAAGVVAVGLVLFDREAWDGSLASPAP
jgi:membrane protease YdiL (CAAX protease family)